MDERLIGSVTHFFAKPMVCAIKLEDELRVGDLVAFRGHTTDLQQEVSSIQIEHEQVESAAAGAEVGVKVDDRVREGDSVYRLA
jgi:translation initiation factor IF-2